jgi:hypothetical protein
MDPSIEGVDDPIQLGIKCEGIVVALTRTTPDESILSDNTLQNQPHSRQSVRGMFGSMGTSEERNYND